MNNTVGDLKDALRKVLPTLPHLMGVIAVEFTMERFKNEDWYDTSSVKWPARKSKKDDKGRKLLVKTSVLKNSIRIVKESPQETVIGTDVKYAKVHNEGDQSTVKVHAHQRTVSVYQSYVKFSLRLNSKGEVEPYTPKSKNKVSHKKIVQVKSHTRKNNIPQRQYMGESKLLYDKLTDMVGKEIFKSLNIK